MKPFIVNRYSASAPAQTARAARALAGGGAGPVVRVTLHGEHFMQRAKMLVVRIGDIFATRCDISPDGQTVVCHLAEMPADGSVITVGYDQFDRVELPERFSLADVTDDSETPTP
jgi:hypothetical protein